jgi:uncharacterized cupredoxin-like copper-binding protein
MTTITKSAQECARRRVNWRRVKRSDINLAAILGAMAATALYSGVQSAEPSARWPTQTAFAAGKPGDPEKSAWIVGIAMAEGDGKLTFAPVVLEASNDEQITFVLKNEGEPSERDHGFALDSFEGDAKHQTAGTVEFVCLRPGQYDDGMTGVVLARPCHEFIEGSNTNEQQMLEVLRGPAVGFVAHFAAGGASVPVLAEAHQALLAGEVTKLERRPASPSSTPGKTAHRVTAEPEPDR